MKPGPRQRVRAWSMKRILTMLGGSALLLVAPMVWAQQPPLLSDKEAFELYGRAAQLMESISVAAPELTRAGAPLVENAQQALMALRAAGGQHAGLTYTFLANVRAYLLLADAVPKPYPFPELARKQLEELRDASSRIETNFRALVEQKEALLRTPDRDNLALYAEANLKLAPAVQGRPRVVFLGDSITYGWRLDEYFPDRDFVNRGIGGQSTGQMLGRMKADVIDLKPAAVLVLAGTNDIAYGIPLRTVENNLTMIADLAQAHRITPLFASVLPINDYHKSEDPGFEMSKRRPPETIRSLNAWIQNLCRERNYIYVDYFSQMADQAGFLRADLTDDGLHPNSAGYRIMAPVALAAIGRVSAPPPKRGVRRLFHR